MKTIKKYWTIIVGFVVMLLTLGLVTKLTSESKETRLDEKIDENENEVSKLEGKVEVIETERVQVKEQIEKHEELIEALEEKKENIIVEERTVADAKDNIIKKTKRGRKLNKK
jgi:septal ring factor EnvC (AmiA/AmiB activator)